MTTVVARGTVAHPPEAVFRFLSDLRNHWVLTGRWIDLLDLTGPALEPDGGRVVMRGPLGFHRQVRTEVRHTRPDQLLEGQAEVGRRTTAVVRWELAPHEQGTEVRLGVRLLRGGAMDRLLLSVGRRWLRRGLVETVARLDHALAGEAG
jgi:uncharacterized protein YndB with AHSA1/START domain